MDASVRATTRDHQSASLYLPSELLTHTTGHDDRCALVARLYGALKVTEVSSPIALRA